ncbi:hypothetical protein TCAL_15439 [Tigriopus californicus]|uniref:Uncharacterized protein n=1 Tax=Tigriopus californicus TaxID=6832 RepID=A0A553PRC3_TIGCA|nr:hypothetical protein TCAL_15439 [Tigriopus californicus]
MNKVGIDFDLAGKTFLIIVDTRRFSGYPFVAHLNLITTKTVWKALVAGSVKLDYVVVLNLIMGHDSGNHSSTATQTLVSFTSHFPHMTQAFPNGPPQVTGCTSSRWVFARIWLLWQATQDPTSIGRLI